jgi:hypothetical protein
MRKRSYTKRNEEYWNRRLAANVPAAPVQEVAAQHIDLPIGDVGDRKVTLAIGGQTNANCGAGRGVAYTNNWAPAIANYELYPNLAAGIMPFSAGNGGYYTMSIPINLATLAYFNIPLVRNTINLLQDFSISPINIRTTNATVKAFVTKWFEAINLSDFMAQWFLEYYRSGNVFIYKFNGKVAEDKLARMKSAYGSEIAAAKGPEIPIRYILLDPKQVYLQVGPNYKGTYSRMLSTFEIERLRNPQTPEDKQVLKDFPPEIQRQIKQNASAPWLYVPLDTSRLYYCFYRKQDYEPLAVPMVWPLLNRLEYKLMLEQADMSLVQTLQQVFMLITAGESVDKNKGVLGTNPKHLANLQAIFQNQTLGRYLVADHTTKAEWKIPDLKELLGKAKYEQVDKDIREGLGYAFFGEDKFANASIKAKLFIENLREGRRVFLDNFLKPEIKKVCEAMGFRHVPEVEFEQIDVQDNTALERVYLQMAQMGLLTPDELNKALNEGLLPSKEESERDQAEYTKLREKGYYTPLAPASGKDEQGRPAGGGGAKPAKKVGQIGTKAGFSMEAVVENVKAITDLRESFANAYRKHYSIKKLNKVQETFVEAAAKAIVVNEPADKWAEVTASYITEPKNIAPEVMSEISGIAVETQTDHWTAVALWKSRVAENVE